MDQADEAFDELVTSLESACATYRRSKGGEPMTLTDVARWAFLHGAKWWEHHKTGGTMWQSDQTLAYIEGCDRYSSDPVVIGRTLADKHGKPYRVEVPTDES